MHDNLDADVLRQLHELFLQCNPWVRRYAYAACNALQINWKWDGPEEMNDAMVIGSLIAEYGSHRDIDAKDRPGLDIRYRTFVFEFADGQVIAEGVSKYKTAGPFLKPGTKTTLAITGGTGAYVGVKGELKTVHLGKGQHRQMLKFVD